MSLQESLSYHGIHCAHLNYTLRRPSGTDVGEEDSDEDDSEEDGRFYRRHRFQPETRNSSDRHRNVSHEANHRQDDRPSTNHHCNDNNDSTNQRPRITVGTLLAERRQRMDRLIDSSEGISDEAEELRRSVDEIIKFRGKSVMGERGAGGREGRDSGRGSTRPTSYDVTVGE